LSEDNYLRLIAASFPTVRAVITELINLNVILNLPKGTEHFVSDVHGEHEAFQHIMNNCSGVIREKVDSVFAGQLTDEQKSELCTLIYYPLKKIELLNDNHAIDEHWYLEVLDQLIALCKILASKYTRAKVRRALPKEYSYIIDELLHSNIDGDRSQKRYHQKILESIVGTGSAEDFVVELSRLIKILAVDKLHIVGDIYDRGPNPDKVMDTLMSCHNTDIQWGNHDILWMGAAAGSEACAAAAIRNNVAARNYTFLESGYGISLRPLALFAEITYPHEESLEAAIVKAISIILFKLEGQIIHRNPQFSMRDRSMMEKINYSDCTVSAEGRLFRLNENDFVTVDPASPNELTPEEKRVVEHLRASFVNSRPLREHINFLYQNGTIYKRYNYNLLYHGCIPLHPDGSFASLELNGQSLSGKALLDEFEAIARKVYFERRSDHTQYYLDCMWYLWCGRLSPLFGRSKMATFERLFLPDPSMQFEEKNAYYHLCGDESVCIRILREFGMFSEYSRIINGHVPVRVSDGESPVKANGRLLVIDGGFCKAYQKTTGIAGYTLVYSSHGMRILSHRPFQGVEAAIENNDDIVSHSDLIETGVQRVLIMDTDAGNEIADKIFTLTKLLEAYKQGIIIPKASQK